MKSTLLLCVLMVTLASAASSFTETEYRSAFINWQSVHQKHYESQEFAQRYAIFKMNMDYVTEWNAKGSQTVLALNLFADISNQEYQRVYLGTRFDASALVVANSEHLSKVFASPTIDWRTKGAVTPVKNQGQCGACWAFSATGATEAAHFETSGTLVSLSEQNLIDCSLSFGNQGCDGGEMTNAFDYIISNQGIMSEASYPYTGVTGKSCHYDSALSAATLHSYTNVVSGSESDLASKLNMGTVSVAIDASHNSFQLYQSGIYYEPACSTTDLDHAVLVVGYGTQGQSNYWIVKNSWSTSWGLNGFITGLFVLLAVVASASANYQCGPHQCYPGSSCVFDCNTNVYGCIPDCNQVTFSQNVVNRWTDDNSKLHLTQVEVTVRNHGPRAVKNIIIDTNHSLALRDAGAIWNVVQAANGDLSFPSYIAPLNAGQSYTFGYINRGDNIASMYLKGSTESENIGPILKAVTKPILYEHNGQPIISIWWGNFDETSVLRISGQEYTPTSVTKDVMIVPIPLTLQNETFGGTIEIRGSYLNAKRSDGSATNIDVKCELEQKDSGELIWYFKARASGTDNKLLYLDYEAGFAGDADDYECEMEIDGMPSNGDTIVAGFSPPSVVADSHTSIGFLHYIKVLNFAMYGDFDLTITSAGQSTTWKWDIEMTVLSASSVPMSGGQSQLNGRSYGTTVSCTIGSSSAVAFTGSLPGTIAIPAGSGLKVPINCLAGDSTLPKVHFNYGPSVTEWKMDEDSLVVTGDNFGQDTRFKMAGISLPAAQVTPNRFVFFFNTTYAKPQELIWFSLNGDFVAESSGLASSEESYFKHIPSILSGFTYTSDIIFGFKLTGKYLGLKNYVGGNFNDIPYTILVNGQECTSANNIADTKGEAGFLTTELVCSMPAPSPTSTYLIDLNIQDMSTKFTLASSNPFITFQSQSHMDILLTANFKTPATYFTASLSDATIQCQSSQSNYLTTISCTLLPNSTSGTLAIILLSQTFSIPIAITPIITNLNPLYPHLNRMLRFIYPPF
eukprot:gene5725-6621_t